MPALTPTDAVPTPAGHPQGVPLRRWPFAAGGAVLVVLVLFLFLFDLRTAAICCTAIPLSPLAAVVVLQEFGVSLNTMTLGGLAIALGEVVDDAVIGIENITRRLRENRRRLFCDTRN